MLKLLVAVVLVELLVLVRLVCVLLLLLLLLLGRKEGCVRLVLRVVLRRRVMV